jgi:anti-anti-sigma factor
MGGGIGMEYLSEIRVDGALPGVTVVALIGDHDLATADELRATIAPALADPAGILVDLTETTFIDSSVVHALYEANQALRTQGRQLVVQIGHGSVVLRTLELTQLTDVVAVAHERPEAVALAGRQAEAA